MQEDKEWLEKAGQQTIQNVNPTETALQEEVEELEIIFRGPDFSEVLYYGSKLSYCSSIANKWYHPKQTFHGGLFFA